MKSIKTTAAVLGILLGIGMASCNTGTDPGETNTERSDYERTEEADRSSMDNDTTENYEKIYEGREGTAIGDSAYNQEGDRKKRYDKDLKPNPNQ
ncbi:hypothetical protein Q4E40_04430 [Pontibacter sp. BT731]|uniref:hypothetical protein n=1 Tax=Pontibacter coccineus TaxID=3063328 RepID=UPI0026E2103A|nr:hypothetical protein [Pontibacter sp. BT731]MDO6389362.1 hypothetical protein [Pontibacter sp. BT731]